MNSTKRLFFVVLFFILQLTSSNSQEREKKNMFIKSFYNKKSILKDGSFEIYLPILTLHDRFFNTYSKEQINSYNETPWGFGFGKSIINEKNNLESFLFIKLQDSHNNAQYITSYSNQKKFYTNKEQEFDFFVGYIIGFSFRADMRDYKPIPFIFPVFGTTYKKISIEGCLLPFFNVLFMWVKYRF